jgi:hypothetical protein
MVSIGNISQNVNDLYDTLKFLKIFITDGIWSCISLVGDLKTALLENSAALENHHHHFHIQGWKYPSGNTTSVISNYSNVGKTQLQIKNSITILIETSIIQNK